MKPISEGGSWILAEIDKPKQLLETMKANLPKGTEPPPWRMWLNLENMAVIQDMPDSDGIAVWPATPHLPQMTISNPKNVAAIRKWLEKRSI